MRKQKTHLFVLLACMLTVSMLTGCTNPLKQFFTKEESSVTEMSADQAQTTAGEESTSGTETETTTASTESSLSDETTTSSDTDGGNPSESDKILITISEDKYFYQNHEIGFEELLDLLDNSEPTVTVELADENATLRAYKKLIAALDEHEIPYLDVE